MSSPWPILLEKAHEAGLLVAVNPSPITKDLLNWPMKLSNYILLNETEGEALSGMKEPAQMISFFQQEYPNTNVVLTLGAQGAYSIFHEERFYQLAFKVPVVDTTAAVDTFTGYYLHSICTERMLRKLYGQRRAPLPLQSGSPEP